MTDDGLFRPLSAKTTSRRSFCSSGREITGRQADSGNVRKVRAAIERRKADAVRARPAK